VGAWVQDKDLHLPELELKIESWLDGVSPYREENGPAPWARRAVWLQALHDFCFGSSAHEKPAESNWKYNQRQFASQVTPWAKRAEGGYWHDSNYENSHRKIDRTDQRHPHRSSDRMAFHPIYNG